MSTRSWKAVFTAIFSLMILAYALQNVANISGGMYASFAYVLGQADHAAYPQSLLPALSHPALVWAALLLVLVLEFTSGILTGYGAWGMWRHRDAGSGEFERAKQAALNGLGLAVVVWFLLFGTMGAAVFQMWQTAIGSGSYNGAFQLTVYALLLFLLISVGD